MGFMETAGGDPGISFGDLKANPPYEVRFTVTGPYTIQGATKPGGEPKMTKDGSQQIMETVVPVRLDWESGDINGLGDRRLFLSGGRAIAMKKAVIAAGGSDLEVGGKGRLKWTKEDKPTQPGHSGARVFEADYKRPEATGFMDAADGSGSKGLSAPGSDAPPF